MPCVPAIFRSTYLICCSGSLLLKPGELAFDGQGAGAQGSDPFLQSKLVLPHDLQLVIQIGQVSFHFGQTFFKLPLPLLHPN
jgi:hypothetical protein